ncbi:DUF1572 domain-containing protein [Fulvivirga maritima]|uniref:DinB family protein n=1 Tax=Fulvivirga maritima TaxID=2904247 RepID=UPI001F456CD2|nr:DinB family protein [Fulvivirga maritima]UII26240.1 DUF1572 domain-containing protein [Fulvivirga maritima]
MASLNIGDELKEHAIHRLSGFLDRDIKCLDELSHEEIWRKPNSSSNSMGHLVLHLCGNLRQYIITTLGQKEDARQRDSEFETTDELDKEALKSLLYETVNEAIDVIAHCSDKDLTDLKHVQAYNYSGVGIIVHAVEHFSHHTGQIIFWTKMLKDKDLAFYIGVDLNKKHNV